MIKTGAERSRWAWVREASARREWSQGSAYRSLGPIWESARAARGVRHPHHRRRRHQLLGGYRQGDGRRGRRGDAGKPALPAPKSAPERSRSIRAAAIRCIGAWAPSVRCRRAARTGTSKRRPQTGARRDRRQGALQGAARGHGLPAGRRAPGRHGILRRSHRQRSQGQSAICPITSTTVQENHPHGIQITKEAPNYGI